MFQLPYFFREALLSLKGNKSASIVALISISFTLMLFGLFVLLYFNLNFFVQSLQKEIRVILYLEDGLAGEKLKILQNRVLKHEAVLDLSYISKDKAVEDFTQSLEGNELLLKGLGENPLPASLELNLKEGFRSSVSVRKLAGEMEKLEGVDDIQYGQEWVENIATILRVLKYASTVGGLVLGLAAMVIISNTIGLTVWARLSEIEVLKMIGATRMYIRAPFLLEGGFLGLAGGVFSISLLHLVFISAQNSLSETGGFLGQSLALNFLPLEWMVSFIIFGAILGFAGSLFSTRRLI